MTDDDAKRHLSEEQRDMWIECERGIKTAGSQWGLWIGVTCSRTGLIALFRELAAKTAALERIANEEFPHGDTPFDHADIARAALAPPPTEGNPA